MADDRFKVDFNAMDTARSDAHRAASDIGNRADEQVRLMQGVYGSGWDDDTAEDALQQHQQRQKMTGYHTDGLNGEGDAYGNIGQIGQDTLNQARAYIGQG
ncbi:hypothetical protein Lfu02_02530 [Longispora fulva]|uniref:Uncharacterized protein n=1 Tax=Longispora fulva TaxID=619741 RepID=A0A8J7GD64_9ACTN|nr:hypothetical protein [Longispora fulva]MBG6135875.1 hypothetical protein [Longispora fulva]GIG55881.1 hypothetical protein Lfu02_02530 [Longispora fulva]